MARAVVLRLAVVVVLVFAAQYAWVSPANFEGYDEWLVLSLASQGIVQHPPANRPLSLLFNLVPAIVFPHDLRGVYLVHGAYLAATGVVAMLLVLACLPGRRRLALLAGVFTVVWAPSDVIRLAPLYAIPYSGVGLALMAAVLLLVESWRRARPFLLVAAVVVASVAARCYEGVIPLLVFAPALLPLARGGDRPRLRYWLGTWTAMTAVLLALVVIPWWRASPETTYQRALLKPDARPTALLGRLAQQYVLHLRPLVAFDAADVVSIAVPLTVVVFVASYAWVCRGRDEETPPSETRRLSIAALVGLAAAGLGYAPFLLSAHLAGARRTQFFSSAGIAMFLAAGIGLVATRLHGRAHRIVPAVLGAWVVAVGTARTLDMQQGWDSHSYFRVQHAVLRQLTHQAPELKPHTLVVLLDDVGAWPADFTFRHAVSYVYPGRAVGHVEPAADDIYYPTRFTSGGIRIEPWALIREAWRSPVDLYRWDEVVVFHFGLDGRLQLLMEWPAALPALPAGARYDPRARIDAAPAPVPSRAILG